MSWYCQLLIQNILNVVSSHYLLCYLSIQSTALSHLSHCNSLPVGLLYYYFTPTVDHCRFKHLSQIMLLLCSKPSIISLILGIKAEIFTKNDLSGPHHLIIHYPYLLSLAILATLLFLSM